MVHLNNNIKPSTIKQIVTGIYTAQLSILPFVTVGNKSSDCMNIGKLILICEMILEIQLKDDGELFNEIDGVLMNRLYFRLNEFIQDMQPDKDK